MGKTLSETIRWEVLDRDELTEEEGYDLEVATRAREQAYAPYSRFRVGAALRMNDGNVFPGSNAENIIYHVHHAEANAIGRIPRASRATGLRRMTTCGALEGEDSEEPVAPCGMCRQDALEIIRPEDEPVIIMAGTRGQIVRMKLRSLLPFGFYPAVLQAQKLGVRG